jgi:hypothetical protein
MSLKKNAHPAMWRLQVTQGAANKVRTPQTRWDILIASEVGHGTPKYRFCLSGAHAA